MEYLVRSAALTGFDSVCRKLGLNPQSLLKQVNLTPAVLRNPDLYISYLSCSRLLEEGAVASGDDSFGLQLAYHQGWHVFGPLGLWLLQAQSLQDLYRKTQAHLSYHVNGAEFGILEIDDNAFLSLELKLDSTRSHSQLIAMSVGLIHQINLGLLEDKWRPLAIWFKHPRPEQTDSYKTFFNCDVRFSQPMNGIAFNRDLLPLQIGAGAGEPAAFAERYFSGQKAALREDLQQVVSNAISSLLPSAECSLATVAACFDLHPRVLQKRLKETDCSFNKLLTDKRYQIARHNLAFSDISMMELALNLGYAETAVFSRAFRRWSGTTPLKWRKENKNSNGKTLVY